MITRIATIIEPEMYNHCFISSSFSFWFITFRIKLFRGGIEVHIKAISYLAPLILSSQAYTNEDTSSDGLTNHHSPTLYS